MKTASRIEKNLGLSVLLFLSKLIGQITTQSDGVYPTAREVVLRTTNDHKKRSDTAAQMVWFAQSLKYVEKHDDHWSQQNTLEQKGNYNSTAGSLMPPQAIHNTRRRGDGFKKKKAPPPSRAKIFNRGPPLRKTNSTDKFHPESTQHILIDQRGMIRIVDTAVLYSTTSVVIVCPALPSIQGM